MSEEKGNNLFEELDFGSFVDELEDSISEPTGELQDEETIDTGEDTGEEQTDEGKSQENDDSAEDAEPSEDNDTTPTEDEEDSSSEEDNSSPLTPYAKLLVDEGILPNFDLDGFDGTADGLKAAMEKEITTGVDNYRNQLPAEIKHLVENYEEGVPLSKLLELDEKRTEYKSISEPQLTESKELQKAIMKDYYKSTTKFSDTKINKLIQTSEDLENLEGEAKEALTDLVKLQDEFEAQEVESAKVAQQEAAKQQEEALKTFKNTLDKTEEIVPGIKINKNIKDTLYKTMTTPVAYDQAGNPVNKIAKYRAENPFEFDIMLSYLFESTKGFKDWSILSSAGRSKAAQSFEDAVKRQNYKGSSGKGGSKSKPTTSSNLLDEISRFKF